MKAAFLTAPRQLEIQESPAPCPMPGEALIRISRFGLCGSDLSFYAGHRSLPQYPHLLGHELVGTLVEATASMAAGSRVIVEPNYPCGLCHLCTSGRGAYCAGKHSMGVDLPGCFAEYVTAPNEFLWPIPDCISDADAATIEPLAVAVHAIRQSGLKPGQTAAILGCGSIGLLIAHVAQSAGIRILAHDLSAVRRARALEFGAIEALPEADVAELWREHQVAAIFECAGVSATVDLALEAAPRGSTILLLGLATSAAHFTPLRIVREGIRIEPCLIYEHPTDFAQTIEQVANGTLQPSRIVTSTHAFAGIAGAFRAALDPDESKVHCIL